MATYKLFNQSISFPDSAERFFDMQYRTWKAMDSASIDFNTWYKKCGDIYTVLKGYEDKAADIVIKYANTSLYLAENLSGDSEKKFLEFCNAWSVVNGESNLDSFIVGFRLGAQFTYDTFINDEAPFKDLLKEV